MFQCIDNIHKINIFQQWHPTLHSVAGNNSVSSATMRKSKKMSCPPLLSICCSGEPRMLRAALHYLMLDAHDALRVDAQVRLLGHVQCLSAVR